MKIINVVGARPNFMKMAPIIDALNKHPDHFEHLLVHPGINVSWTLRQGGDDISRVGALCIMLGFDHNPSFVTPAFGFVLKITEHTLLLTRQMVLLLRRLACRFRVAE